MTEVRLSPSGPVLFSMGAGARLRLAEANSVMGGSLQVPTPGDAADAIISPDGFGDPAALVLSLATPKAALYYRAKLLLDLVNATTNVDPEVTLYLDFSADGGSTYTNLVKNAHLVQSTGETTGGARQVEIHLPLTVGANLGVVDGTTTSIKLRARAIQTVGALAVQVTSAATSGAETNLSGTIHMELEECLDE